MPLHYQQNINANTRLAVWKITEDEAFFLEKVPLQATVVHPHKRLQHLAGRYLLQFLFPGFPVSAIAIASTRKPFLANESFHFSISHCGEFAAAIVSTQERVGIDIEQPGPRLARIKEKFLGESERANWNLSFPATTATHAPAAIQRLTLLWGCKEAVYKWWGRGALDFKQHMQTVVSSLDRAGQLTVRFSKTETQDLPVSYCILDDLCLVWIHTSVQD